MGGKATKKKNGNVYYYYYCNNCKLNLKENVIEEYFENFINEIVDVCGFDKSLIEFKLASNSKLKQNLKNQVEI